MHRFECKNFIRYGSLAIAHDFQVIFVPVDHELLLWWFTPYNPGRLMTSGNSNSATDGQRKENGHFDGAR